MRHIPDPIERGEAMAERCFDERFDGKLFTCYCGNKFDPENEGGYIHDNPWAPPFCNECCEKAFKGHDT